MEFVWGPAGYDGSVGYDGSSGYVGSGIIGGVGCGGESEMDDKRVGRG